ncbi:YlzJ-like family protein [Paenibacillus beijingensis]|uniref:YlzJ-like protein n=1 Tax=Paenibacillus beijingensis TaxID=1126833 RepID=A0A0D5NP04_9BACL|nr:YlzJ-like family protein [Paenibacillus beijingensis]AJY76623.1 hypothetical protein VN24_21165 [Paenibacillus beijingensis]
MTLYTNMPLELVLDGFHGERPSLMTIRINGVVMEVEPVAPGTGKIVRLLECDLYQYLNAQYAPGELVSFFADAVVSPNH